MPKPDPSSVPRIRHPALHLFPHQRQSAGVLLAWPVSALGCVALVCGLILAGCGGDDSPRELATKAECNPLGGQGCVLPFPSSIYEVDDAMSPTGRSLAIPEGVLPRNADGIAVDPAPYNKRDGFSPAAPIIIAFPSGIQGDNLVYLDRLADSITDDSPTVLIDMKTGERVVHFAELDANSIDKADRQALFIRPAARLRGSSRYAVAIRKSLLARDGSPLAIPEGFRALLDDAKTDHVALERTRARYKEIFAALDQAKVPREDLVVAWDFTTASDASIRADMLAARDAALPEMGMTGEKLAFEVTSDGPLAGDDTIARSIVGTFDAPLFLDNGGGYDVGVKLVRDAATGQPTFQGLYRAPFYAIVPTCAESAAAPVPILIFGHGLLGSGDQILDSTLRTTATTLCMVMVATDMRGMSAADLDNVASVLTDINNAPEVLGVIVQGMINHIALQHIVRGPMAQTLFVDRTGASLVDPTKVFFYGLSQGHIFGSTFVAYDDFITRAVLGVGGANYSMMLERSSNWPLYRLALDTAYPDPLDVALFLHLLQVNWDTTDPSGIANDELSGAIPGTPAKQLLLHMSVNDAQVPNIATGWQVRSMGEGMTMLSPTALEIFGVPTKQGPLTTGLVVFDGGFEPLPEGNVSPDSDNGAHGLTRRQPAALRQMAEFYATGQISNQCGATGCFCATGACD